MLSSHVAANDVLAAILKKKAPLPPPTLLKAAYSTISSTLELEDGPTFDSDYVSGQVNYQRANAALYQYEIANGSDLDLKAFAHLPKIQDHLQRALKLQITVRGFSLVENRPSQRALGCLALTLTVTITRPGRENSSLNLRN